MSTKKKLLQAAAGSAGGAGLNVEEVFNTYLYEGNSSTQTITNGIDLSGEGGLVWIKDRTSSSNQHSLNDTERGATKYLKSSSTDAEGTGDLTSFNSNGFSVRYQQTGYVNENGMDLASWTFRKAPKFFDVVTYTGNGVSGRQISHNLGCQAGMVVVKRTDSANNWPVWHRKAASYGQTDGYYQGRLESTADFGYSTITSASSTTFTVNTDTGVNANGGSYVAYIFAHNDGDGDFGPTGDQDIIKCGSFTTNGSGDASVDLGFEPQWIIYKRSDGTSNWGMNDNMRGWADTYWNPLYADASNAESGFSATRSWPTATGFEFAGQLSASANYIYMAIRRGPLAEPESATDVFKPVQYNGTKFPTGFPVDFGIAGNAAGTDKWYLQSRLQGGVLLNSASTAAEVGSGSAKFDLMDGYGTGFSTAYYSTAWKRAPNFFDVVAYTGNGTAGRTVSHNLGVAPEMMWVKSRDAAYDWRVYHSSTGATKSLELNLTSAAATNSYIWNDTAPTDSVFSLGTHTNVNKSGDDYIAYLFATLDGVSKVGSYTGNSTGSTTQTIDCGFSSGARFVLIKKINGTGPWAVFDIERGIAVGNDPYLELNDTGAENNTNDRINPHSSGFTLSSNGLFNGLGDEYIFYAIA